RPLQRLARAAAEMLLAPPERRERNVDVRAVARAARRTRGTRRRIFRFGPDAVLPRDGRDVRLVERELPDAPDTVLEHVTVVVHAAPELRGEEVAGAADRLARARLKQAKAADRGTAVVRNLHDGLHEPVIRDAGLLRRRRAAHARGDEPVAADVIALERRLLETLLRSEERRVGKEGRPRCAADPRKKD